MDVSLASHTQEILDSQILTHFSRHVLKDIDPYICLFEACDKPNDCFKTVHDWLNHVQWQHTLVFSCHSEGHESELFSSRTEFEQHMEQEHSGEFSETQLPFLVQKSAEPSPDTFAAFARARQSIGASKDTTNLCPLCPFSVNTVNIPSQSNPLVPSDLNIEDRAFQNILNHITNHMESIALLSLPVDNNLDNGVSDELRSQNGEDFERDDQNLPSPTFLDDPSRQINPFEDLSGEVLPIDGDSIEEGWNYVLESPDVQKMAQVKSEHDEILQPFVARYMTESKMKLLTPSFKVPFRRKKFFMPCSTVPFPRNPDFVGRENILAQIHDRFSRPPNRAALVGLEGVGYGNILIFYRE